MPLFQTISIVFPLLLPIWQERPLNKEDFNLPEALRYAETEDIRFAVDGLKYADPELKESIIRQLGNVESSNARDALVELLPMIDEPSLKAAVLDALDGFDPLPKTAAAPVFECLSHPAARVRLGACRNVAHAPASPQIAARLLALAADDPDARVRQAALDAMMPNQIRAVTRERLLPFISNASPPMRAIAWEACLAVESESDAEKLPGSVLSSVPDDDSPLVRFTVAENLRPLRGADAEAVLLALSNDSRSSVRARAAETLAEFDDSTVQTRLLGLLGDVDDEVRRAAAASLRTFANSATVSALVERLGDPSKFVRTQVFKTLVELNSMIPVSDSVALALNAENADAREGACEVLGEIGADSFAPTILSLVSGEDRASNISAAVMALGKLNWRGARATVAGLASHTDAGVRRAVAFALGNIGDESTRETLTTLVRDDDLEVRGQAIAAIGRLADAFFLPLLVEVLNDAKSRNPSFRPEDRMASMWSLARVAPIPADVVKHIHGHITRPVIPTMMGPVFDSEPVLVSGLFALAEIARRNSAASSYFNSAQTLFSRELAPGQAVSPSTLMPTPALREYARQADALFEHGTGAELEPVPIPARSVNLPYRKR